MDKKISPRANNTPPTPRWQRSDTFGIETSHLQKAAAISEVVKKQEQCSDLSDLIEKAEKGSVDAQIEVADYYAQGKDMPVQPQKAFHYYRLAAEQGDIYAYRRLGFLYEWGDGVEFSYEKAFHYYLLAANEGSRRAKHKVGWFYENGIAVEKDLEKATKYYSEIVSEDDFLGLECLAHMYEEGLGVEQSDGKAKETRREIFKRSKTLADEGDTSQQLFVARCYKDGENVERSYAQAYKYYALAAQKNDSLGLLCLGNCYEYGRGTKESIDMAERCYQKAAELGLKYAELKLCRLMLETDQADEAVDRLKLLSQTTYGDDRATSHYLLGKCYENGQGVEKSYSVAVYHYDLATRGNDTLAQARLAEAYLNGELDLAPNPKQSYAYYKLAGENNYLEAWKFLALAHEEGIGCERSEEQAKLYRNKIAKKTQAEADAGDSSSQVVLGNYYSYGKYVAKSAENAFKYYALAADQNHPSGIYHLGCCYEEGFGVEVSIEKARDCYHRAANLGSIASQLVLADAYKKGDLGFEPSLEKSQYYFQLVESQNSVEAAEYLSMAFEKGFGVEKSPEKAHYYQQIAANAKRRQSQL